MRRASPAVEPSGILAAQAIIDVHAAEGGHILGQFRLPAQIANPHFAPLPRQITGALPAGAGQTDDDRAAFGTDGSELPRVQSARAGRKGGDEIFPG